MGYISNVFLFTVVIFSGKRHDELLQVTILLPTILVVVFSQSRVLLKIVYIHGFGAFRNATLLLPSIVRMGAHTVGFNLKNRFFRCSCLFNLYSFGLSSHSFAFINH